MQLYIDQVFYILNNKFLFSIKKENINYAVKTEFCRQFFFNIINKLFVKNHVYRFDKYFVLFSFGDNRRYICICIIYFITFGSI